MKIFKTMRDLTSFNQICLQSWKLSQILMVITIMLEKALCVTALTFLKRLLKVQDTVDSILRQIWGQTKLNYGDIDQISQCVFSDFPTRPSYWQNLRSKMLSI